MGEEIRRGLARPEGREVAAAEVEARRARVPEAGPMKLPWVTRDQYDAVIDNWEHRVIDLLAEGARAHARADRLAEENARLTQVIITMQRQGYAAPLPQAEVPRPPALP